MKLKHDPVPLVLEEGDYATRLDLLEFLGLLKTWLGTELTLTLLKSQKPDGGYPSCFNRKLAGIRETCRLVLLLLRCQVPSDGLNVQAAVKFLLNHQRKDGGWSENPILNVPKEIVELSTQKSVTWLTADVIELLHKVELGSNDACKNALSWLRKIQGKEGGWFMFESKAFSGPDPDSTARIAYLMKEIYGEDDPIYLKSQCLVESFLDRLVEDTEKGYYVAPNGEERENDIYHLTHLILTPFVDTKRRIEASYKPGDGRLKKIANAIEELQREDGGWRPFWSEKSDPVYTVLALKLLTWVEVLDPDETMVRAEKYCGRVYGPGSTQQHRVRS